MDNIITVSQVNNYIHQIFVSEELLHNITVIGEISNWSVKGGNAYFIIKDSCSLLNCTCFGIDRTYIPKDGESVLVVGSPSYYVKGGKLNFNVNSIVPSGNGAIMLQLEQLKLKLANEGIFQDTHKKDIPRLINSVAVIASKSGAVIHDIIRTIRNKNKLINISLIDVRVQGIGAVEDMVNALSLADSIGVDVIIIARGGGSFEDLLPFYDERLLRAIYSIETPIISAVGHETDFTYCDLVADERAATPTAAAELIGYDVIEIMDRVKSIITSNEKRVNRLIEFNNTKYINVINIILNKIESNSALAINKLRALSAKLDNNIDNIITNKSQQLQTLLTRIDTMNPINYIKKGLFKINCEGNAIISIKEIKLEDKLTIHSYEGTINAVVKEIKLVSEGENNEI